MARFVPAATHLAARGMVAIVADYRVFDRALPPTLILHGTADTLSIESVERFCATARAVNVLCTTDTGGRYGRPVSTDDRRTLPAAARRTLRQLFHDEVKADALPAFWLGGNRIARSGLRSRQDALRK